MTYAELTQLGECYPYKLEVVGSSPIFCTIATDEWLGNNKCVY